jgi:regulatory protein
MRSTKPFTRPSKAEALNQLARYCAYRERCHSEVRGKLLDIGMRGEMLEEIIAELITKGFLNEQRFAQEFVIGKFKALKWGRVKLINELRRKDVPKQIIHKALEALDDDRYVEVLQELAGKKLKSLPGRKSLKKRAALQRFLIGKGYEGEIVRKVVSELV